MEIEGTTKYFEFLVSTELEVNPKLLKLKLTSFRNTFTSPVSWKESLAYLITETG